MRDRARTGSRWSPVRPAASGARWPRRSRGKGSAVVVADLDGEQAEAVAAGIRDSGGDALAVAVDVADVAAVERLAATTIDRFGRVDVLCNNAGVSTFNLIRDQTLDDWQWVFDVNLWGVVHGMHTFVPIMREQGTPGHIVNTASIGGLLSGVAFIGPYCATKVAVVSISETLAQELAIDETADRGERAVPELGRHQGDGVGARPAGGPWRRAAHRDGRVGAADDPRRLHRSDRSDPGAGRRAACWRRSAAASSGSSPTTTSFPTVEAA